MDGDERAASEEGRELARAVAESVTRSLLRANPLEYWDCVLSEAWYGVLLAARSFDPGRGVPWKNWAYLVARRHLVAFVRRFVYCKGFSGLFNSVRKPGFRSPRRLAVRDLPAPDPPEAAPPDPWGALAGVLDAREAAVILGQFRDGKTVTAVAAELGVSGTTVTHLRRRALAKLSRSFPGWGDRP